MASPLSSFLFYERIAMKIISVHPAGSALFVYALNDEGDLYYCNVNVENPTWKRIILAPHVRRGGVVADKGYHITTERMAYITDHISTIHISVISGQADRARTEIEHLMQYMDHMLEILNEDS